MKKREVKDYVSLGSSIQFIKNIRNDQSLLANKNDNGDTSSTLCVIKWLLNSIECLGFVNTVDSVAFKQLKDINAELNKSSTKALKLTENQASRLRSIANNLETALHKECNKKSIFELGSEESLSMVSPPPDNGNNDWKKSIADYMSRNPILAFILGFLALSLIGFTVYSVGKGWISFPGRIEPNGQEEPSVLKEDNPPLKVLVNLFCTWKSQGNLTKPIEAAAVTAINVRTGDPIDVLGKGIDTDGRISFEMKKDDIVAVTIRHPDILDSQVTIPNIKINKEDSELKRLNYTVSKTNCYLDRKKL